MRVKLLAASILLIASAALGQSGTALSQCSSCSGGGSSTWGGITGALADQTDLSSALNLKAPLIGPSFTNPNLNNAVATTVNKVTITQPASGATLTIINGKTLIVSNDATVSGSNLGDQVVPANTTSTSSNWFSAYDSSVGTFTKSRPACADLSNAAATCSSAAYSSLTGTPQLANTIAATSGNWLRSYDATTGNFTKSQPSFADVSGSLSHSQLPTLLSGDIPANSANTSGTAAALTANGTNCSAGNAAAGVDASGNAEGCTVLTITKAAVTSNALISYNAATGLFTAAQLNFTDLLGNLAHAQLPTLLSGDIPDNAANSTGSAAKWTTARNLAGNSVDGSANVAFANKFIVQGTADSGLSMAQFLGAIGTGILKNTTTTGVLSIAVAGDFPTLNQDTTGSASKLTTPRAINGVNFDGSAAITIAAAAGTLTGTLATSAEPAHTGDATNSAASLSMTVKQLHLTETAITFSSSPYAVLSTDSVITCDASAGAVTINLPASSGGGRYISIKKIDSSSNACTPTRAGSDTIDGATSYSLTTQYAASNVVDTASGTWSRMHVNQLGGDLSGISTNASVNKVNGSTPGVSAIAHQFVTAIDSSARGTLAQPIDADLSFTDVTTGNATTSQHGYLLKLGGGTSNFLRADGTWAAPSGFTAPTGTGAVTVTAGTLDAASTSFTPNATASTIASRDSSANMRSNSYIDGYTTTATAAGTTTLAVASTKLQFFTGTTTQTVTLPVTSTLVTGQEFQIINLSTGTVTVNSSGANLVLSMPANAIATIKCILTSGTSAASWSAIPLARTDVSQTFSGQILTNLAGFDCNAGNMQFGTSGGMGFTASTASGSGICSGGAMRVKVDNSKVNFGPSVFGGAVTDALNTLDAGFNRVAANVMCVNNGTAGTCTTWLQNAGPSRVKTSDVTNATATMTNITGLTATLIAGHFYSGEMVVKCINSTATEGIQFDFNGGTATMTSFFAGGGILASGGTDVVGNNTSTALATAITFTTFTGESLVTIKFSFKVNAAGTFIPRFAENTSTVGTATVRVDSYMLLADTQ